MKQYIKDIKNLSTFQQFRFYHLSYGERIKFIRERLGYLQEAVAKRMHIDKETLSKVERGKVDCKKAYLLLFAKAVNFDILSLAPEYSAADYCVSDIVLFATKLNDTTMQEFIEKYDKIPDFNIIYSCNDKNFLNLIKMVASEYDWNELLAFYYHKMQLRLGAVYEQNNIQAKLKALKTQHGLTYKRMMEVGFSEREIEKAFKKNAPTLNFIVKFAEAFQVPIKEFNLNLEYLNLADIDVYYRKKNGIRQLDFANEIGVDVRTLKKVKQEHQISPHKFIQLEAIYYSIIKEKVEHGEEDIIYKAWLKNVERLNDINILIRGLD